MEMDKKGEIKRNMKTPIKKDNIMMPVGGWAVVRFKADNYGMLLGSCFLLPASY